MHQRFAPLLLLLAGTILASAIKRIQVIYDKSQPILLPETVVCIKDGTFRFARRPEIVVFEGEMLSWPSQACQHATLYTFSESDRYIFNPLIECTDGDGVGYGLDIQETKVGSSKDVDHDTTIGLIRRSLMEAGSTNWPLVRFGILTVFDRCFHFREETVHSVKIRCCGGKIRRVAMESMHIGHFFVLNVLDQLVDISMIVKQAQGIGSGVCLVTIKAPRELAVMFLGKGEQTNRLTLVIVSQD